MQNETNKNYNDNTIFKEPVDSLDKIIDDGKINGMYVLRKLIAQDYFYFYEKDVQYGGKSRKIKKIRGNDSNSGFLLDGCDALGMSALIKDYIEYIESVDELKLASCKIKKHAKQLLNNRNLSGISLIDFFQNKVLSFINMKEEFKPILKDAGIEGEPLLIGVHPIIFEGVPNIEDLLKRLIVESYKYNNNEQEAPNIVLVNVDMIANTTVGSAEDILRASLANRIRRREIIDLIKKEKKEDSLKGYLKECKELMVPEGIDLCNEKLKVIEDLKRRKREAEKAVDDQNSYEGLLDAYNELIEACRAVDDKKTIAATNKKIEKTKQCEAAYEKACDFNTITDTIELFEKLDDTPYVKERIEACNIRMGRVYKEIIENAESKCDRKKASVLTEKNTIDEEIRQFNSELESLGIFKGKRKKELRELISQKRKDIRDLDDLLIRFDMRMDFIRDILNLGIGSKVFFGIEESPYMEKIPWMIVNKRNDYIVLYGLKMLGSDQVASHQNFKLNEYPKRIFNDDERSIIERCFSSIATFEANRSYNSDFYLPNNYEIKKIDFTKTFRDIRDDETNVQHWASKSTVPVIIISIDKMINNGILNFE